MDMVCIPRPVCDSYSAHSPSTGIEQKSSLISNFLIQSLLVKTTALFIESISRVNSWPDFWPNNRYRNEMKTRCKISTRSFWETFGFTTHIGTNIPQHCRTPSLATVQVAPVFVDTYVRNHIQKNGQQSLVSSMHRTVSSNKPKS